jgi:dienelactone hydrolase
MSRRRVLAAGAIAGGGAAAWLAAPAATRAQGAGPTASSSALYLHWPEQPFYSFQLLRAIGQVHQRGAEFSELIGVANRIGSPAASDAWVREFGALAEDILSRARALAERDRLGAGEMWLRAAVSYLRCAEFLISPATQLAEKVATYSRAREAFALYRRTLPMRIQAVQVPYEGQALYAYYAHPQGRRPRAGAPAVVLFGGLDSIGEELYLWAGQELARRGIAALVVDGPGNGATLRYGGIATRHDYEVAARAAVNYLVRRRDVDERRIGLLGISLGGYYAARSAAYERRLRACVVWGAIWDVPAILQSGSGDADTQRFFLEQGAWVFGNNDVEKALAESELFRLDGHAQRIRCPTLILHGEDDPLVPVEQAYALDAAIRAPHELHVYPSGSVGATHCQADAPSAAWEYFVPFLLEHLARPGPDRRPRTARSS